ncbi:unnamed protein product, partial [Anisakis simplex]|uniref:ATP-dependent RNA helicase n=1 Tax=Anisakis simplex TaxID=6269 RepID=A0A0M3JCC1_ANISI
MLIFVSTRFCVEYFKKLMERFLKKRKIFGIHGKKKKNREQEIELFKKTPKSVMLCTDLMSRGIDIEDIDCVIQFDIPRESSWFVHRAGRCARSGRPGKNLLLLTTEESGYVEFISKYESLRMENIKIKTSNALKAEELRTRTIKMAVQDRDILECGTRAFVS